MENAKMSGSGELVREGDIIESVLDHGVKETVFSFKLKQDDVINCVSVYVKRMKNRVADLEEMVFYESLPKNANCLYMKKIMVDEVDKIVVHADEELTAIGKGKSESEVSKNSDKKSTSTEKEDKEESETKSSDKKSTSTEKENKEESGLESSKKSDEESTSTEKEDKEESETKSSKNSDKESMSTEKENKEESGSESSHNSDEESTSTEKEDNEESGPLSSKNSGEESTYAEKEDKEESGTLSSKNSDEELMYAEKEKEEEEEEECGLELSMDRVKKSTSSTDQEKTIVKSSGGVVSLAQIMMEQAMSAEKNESDLKTSTTGVFSTIGSAVAASKQMVGRGFGRGSGFARGCVQGGGFGRGHYVRRLQQQKQNLVTKEDISGSDNPVHGGLSMYLENAKNMRSRKQKL